MQEGLFVHGCTHVAEHGDARERQGPMCCIAASSLSDVLTSAISVRPCMARRSCEALLRAAAESNLSGIGTFPAVVVLQAHNITFTQVIAATDPVVTDAPLIVYAAEFTDVLPRSSHGDRAIDQPKSDAVRIITAGGRGTVDIGIAVIALH